MSYSFSVLAVILSFTMMTAGCSKKSSKGSRGARPAASPGTTPAPKGEPPAPTAADLDEDSRPSDKNRDEEGSAPRSRLSEEERSRFDNSRYSETPAPPERRDTELADAPDAQGEEPANTPEPAGADRDAKCGIAFGNNSQQWAPGLPYAPAKVKICTGGTVKKLENGEQFSCENNKSLVFTDARQDGLMALAVEQANRVSKHMDEGSRELARRIRGVKVNAGRNSRDVRVEVQLLVAEKQHEKIELRGAMNGRDAGIRLIPVNSPRGLKFSAVLTCADSDGSCSNGILRLQQLTRRGKVGRLAYVVIRSGDAHVTVSEQDRVGYRDIQNKDHAQFAEYLSNTTYNTCVSILRETVNGQRQLPTCAYKRLKAVCGAKAQFKRPAAQAFEFQSWAVAYGPAGFQFEMIDRETARFVVKGPLVAGNETPVWSRPLKVTGAFGNSIERAVLVANDGGGNLNLQIDFKGSAHTRMSVTTVIEDIRYNSDAIMARARQMPTLSEGEIAADEELRDDEREDRGEPRIHDRRDNRRVVAPTGKPGPVVRPRPLPPGADDDEDGHGPRVATRPLPPQPKAAQGKPVPPKNIPNAKPNDKAAPGKSGVPSAKPTGKPSEKSSDKPVPPSSIPNVPAGKPAAPAAKPAGKPTVSGNPTVPSPADTLVPMPEDGKSEPAKVAPGKPAPAPAPAKAGTRPLPAQPKAAGKPAAPADGPRFEAPPKNPPTGVPAREEDDNQVIQPRDGAPQTLPPE